MIEHDHLGRPIRAALFVGFGLIVGVWIFVAYYFTNRIADVEKQATEINARYMHSQELLSTVRSQVLLGSVYVRDALLDPDPTTAPAYRRRLEESYRAVDQALHQYVPILDSAAERQQVAHLREEINNFRTGMLDVLATDATRWPADARALLRARVMPKRELVIGLSDQAQALNRNAFIQQQSAIANVYATTQRRTSQILGAAVVASFGIALLATLYAGGLEDRLRRQRQKDVRNTRELQELSAKLLNAQEEERRNIARELHDEVGQALTAIKVELALVQRDIDNGAVRACALDDARTIADGVLHTVRDLSHLLHPALLDDLGLAAATEWYLKGFAKRHGVRTDVLHERMEERLTPEIEAAIYRIIQEALTNVAKHARASRCRVYLQRLTNTLLVTIEDDGIGFDPADVQSAGGGRGLGLVSIRERVAQLHGTVRLESSKESGTRVTIEVPAQVRTVIDFSTADQVYNSGWKKPAEPKVSGG